MSALERNTGDVASASDEDLGPSTDWREIPRGSLQLAWRLDFLEAIKWVPDIPVLTHEKPKVSCHDSRMTCRFLFQRELRPDSPAMTQEQSHAPPRTQMETGLP